MINRNWKGSEKFAVTGEKVRSSAEIQGHIKILGFKLLIPQM